jgi:general secretion pathway protein B
MSYILDALRKSEQARQTTAGQGINAPYPIKSSHEHKSWLIPSLLTLVVVLFTGIIWLILTPQQSTKFKDTHTVEKAPTSSQPLAQQNRPSSSAHSKLQNSELPPGKHARQSVSTAQQTPQAKAAAATAQLISNSEKSGPLKDLPPLNISGFVRNGQTGSLAMINNRLVHEGEEISPGLRLEKIKEDSAIFSYKGYVFSR